MAVNVESVRSERDRVERLRSVGTTEASRLIGCRRSKLAELVASGELKSYKVGKERRFLVSDIEAFIRSRIEA